jgi:hypothetical protein
MLGSVEIEVGADDDEGSMMSSVLRWEGFRLFQY